MLISIFTYVLLKSKVVSVHIIYKNANSTNYKKNIFLFPYVNKD